MWLSTYSSLLWLFVIVDVNRGVFGLQDVTGDLFGQENAGTVAAFGDFNSDKQTDLFVIREDSELVIFLADVKTPYFKPKIHVKKDAFPSGVSVISSVVPADYDGDSQMDVLLTGHTTGSDLQQTTVFIFWGNNQTLNQSARVDLNRTFKDQPLVMDFNGDMVPDIFGVVDQSTEVCYLRDRKPKCEKALGADVQIRVPHSNAFIDLNKDFTADLFLSTGSTPAFGFETWINTDGNFTRNFIIKAPENVQKVGQSAFVDFGGSSDFKALVSGLEGHKFKSQPDQAATAGPLRKALNPQLLSYGDGSQDHLLPVCMDAGCSKSAIYLAKPGLSEWVPVLTDFQRKDSVWGFVPPPDTPSADEFHPLITLHLGDYNLDGFPDALAILRNTSNSAQQQAFLLENVECSNVSCKDVGRMFRVHWDQSDLNAIPKAVVATFFDIYEDGILDMIVLSRTEGKKELTIHALKNNFEADAYFVKVIGK
ncbi:T-cell immunomodulatory protein isoform X1 [Silurus meridionalis]|nr:T-cell immunomodulatory protein isoform X1 [Silurus meridionalis]